MPRPASRSTRICTAAALLLLVQAADAVDLPATYALAGSLNGGLSWASSNYRCDDCNVILVSIDTLRQDHVGAYGYQQDTTPNIDSFADDAMRFEHAIAMAPSTLPSHASIFTSMIPEHHRAFRSTERPLPDDAVTMAEILFQAGYRTGGFTAGAQMHEKYNVDQGFDVYDSFEQEMTHASRFSDIVEKGKQFLDEHGDEQFFLFLHTYEVHTPYTPPREYLQMFDPGYEGDLGDEITLQYLRSVFENPVRLRVSEMDRRHIVAAYDGEIRNMDAAFGDLVSYLRERGLYDNTLIVFTSDHGEEFGERGRHGWHSWTLYDELLTVPLLIKLPGSRYGGQVFGEVARGIDLLPTMVDLLDIDTAQPFEGQSLMDRVLNRRTDVVFAVSQRDYVGALPTSIRTARWKLYDGALYDLAVDPIERRDVSAEYPHVRTSLDANLAVIRSHTALDDADPIELDEALRRELRDLGYIQ